MHKLPLYIVTTLTLGLFACTSPQKVIKFTKEPALVIKPFKYSGRTWFDTNKAILRPAGKKELTTLSTYLRQAKQQGLITTQNKLLVIGHTDSRASMQYNQKLSERRAASVARFLISKGIPSTTITAFGKGETQPVATNLTQAGMQKNRRVEIHIQGPAINIVYN